ncbi:putative acyltransferase [Pseudocercospora fuligena]|uniref:Putative acyltransferase n=1 Tax=Pseudocercospora fuligena TaxID=685502 RepID=A0A8H6RP03_9PEZI|nr:putative acyltransferase [Pseudocercospora fuligena]
MSDLDQKVSAMNLDYSVFDLGDWKLKHGGTIPKAQIAYKTFDKYFIIITALFGNGQSSSPSNRKDIRPWPEVTFYDNVRAQHELVTKKFGVSHARAVLGWSMGAGQTYQWATQYPDFMDLVVPFCGSAKTALHNQSMLEGVKVAVLGGKGASSGGVCKGEANIDSYRAWSEEEKNVGLKALGRVYSGWGFSQPFYRQRLFESVLGFKDIEDFMVNFWEAWALSKGEGPDPDNMVAMLYTWQAGDCSAQEPYNGDFDAAMKGIKAKALVMPGQTDLYFPPEDSEDEVARMKPGIGKCVPFPSIWGHWAGGPGQSTEDVKFLDDQLREFFAAN